MDFVETQTFNNLARAFAGECQAGMRYQLIAKTAFAQGYKVLSDEIRHIAKNETNHAKVFFDKIIDMAGPHNNIDINAGYPFSGGELVDGLLFAMQGEEQESFDIYPKFGDIAAKEGFDDIARIFYMTARVEELHMKQFEYLHKALKNNTLYKSDKPLLWTCDNCGYQTVAKESFRICPLCQVSQGFVQIHLPKEILK